MWKFPIDPIRLIAIVLLLTTVPPIAFVVGRRLEQIEIRPDRPIRSWLFEIGSDIRWLLIFLSVCGAIKIALSPYFSWLSIPMLAIIKVGFSVFFLLISVAGISVFVEFAHYWMRNNQNLTKNDRRNLATLLPIASSAIKLCLYFLFAILFLASLSVDVRPFLEVGGIALVILGLAGQSIIADMLSTLFIFTDRLFYVGDRLAIQCNSEWFEGEVISITLRHTIIDCGDGKRLAIANRQLDKFQKLQ